MDRVISMLRTHTWVGGAMKAALVAAMASGVMGLECDQQAATAFRHAVTQPMGEAVKTVLGGDPEAGLSQMVSVSIDGLVASIEQAGRPPSGK